MATTIKNLRHPYLDLILIAITVAVVFLSAFAAGRKVIPHSVAGDFITVSEVTVFNTPYGLDPKMSVDRVIHREFSARWVTTVRPIESLEYACGSSGSSPYRPDAGLPNNLYLFDFWLFDKGDPASLCRKGFYPLPRGCYIVDTTWEFVDPLSLTTLAVHNRSSEFCIE